MLRMFVREGKWGVKTSPVVWIPVISIAILGSRPFSLWISGGGTLAAAHGKSMEGTSLDVIVYLVLMVAGYWYYSGGG